MLPCAQTNAPSMMNAASAVNSGGIMISIRMVVTGGHALARSAAPLRTPDPELMLARATIRCTVCTRILGHSLGRIIIRYV